MDNAKREKRSGRKSRLHRARSSDPAVSYQSGLLDVTLDDSDLPSTSSVGGSPYYRGRNDEFPPSAHMLGLYYNQKFRLEL